MARSLYAKPHVKTLGDKSPDIYRHEELVRLLAERAPLVYTVRDPRAIMRSIYRQESQSEEAKANRWSQLIGNIRAWKPYIDQQNILVTRYEDLVAEPVKVMNRVYAHLGLDPSERFLEAFERKYPARFLWKTAVDWETGVRKAFDPARARIADADLSDEQLSRVYENEDIAWFMNGFGYPMA